MIKKRLNFRFFLQFVLLYLCLLGMVVFIVAQYLHFGVDKNTERMLKISTVFAVICLFVTVFFYLPGNCSLEFANDYVVVRRFWHTKIFETSSIKGVSLTNGFRQPLQKALVVFYFEDKGLKKKLRRARVDDIYEMTLPKIADMITAEKNSALVSPALHP